MDVSAVITLINVHKVTVTMQLDTNINQIPKLVFRNLLIHLL